MTVGGRRVCTPRGWVKVAWRVEGRRFGLEVEAPAATAVHVWLPNGEQREFDGGKFSAEVALS